MPKLSVPFLGVVGSPTKIDKSRKQKRRSNLFQSLKSGGPSHPITTQPSVFSLRYLEECRTEWEEYGKKFKAEVGVTHGAAWNSIPGNPLELFRESKSEQSPIKPGTADKQRVIRVFIKWVGGNKSTYLVLSQLTASSPQLV